MARSEHAVRGIVQPIVQGTGCGTENFFGKLKEFKRIAMRACKTDTSFAAMIYAAAAILNSK